MEKFLEKIAELKSKSLYRKLINIDFISDVIAKKNKKKLISFASNDYLGLANSKKVKKSAIKAIKKFGLGARSSRYICGNNSLYQKLEKKISEVKSCDDTIIFSSGYMAAIGTIQALATKGDLIIADKLIHSCLIDGAKLSGAKLLRFKHNDIEHLKELIVKNRQNYQNILMISESIFSMDGDSGKINQLEQIAIKYNCYLLIDYAHDLYDMRQKHKKSLANIIKMGTLSKAIGAYGGFIASDKLIIDYLRNFAKSAIYNTALSPSILAGALESFNIIENKNPAQKTLENVNYFCQLTNFSRPESAIVIIEVESAKKALEIAQKAEDFGLLISAIRPPTSKTPRLRISFSAKHNKKQIEKLANFLKDNKIL